jgi:hypothetical protein
VTLLSGIGGLRIAPHLRDKWNPNDATHRSFDITYRSRVGDAAGNPPGLQEDTVNLDRRPGGPWRISYIGDGV